MTSLRGAALDVRKLAHTLEVEKYGQRKRGEHP